MADSDLGLPLQAVLAEDLSLDGELAATVEQTGADDDLVAENGLVVVQVRGAVGAVIAVDWLACVGERKGSTLGSALLRVGSIAIPESP